MPSPSKTQNEAEPETQVNGRPLSELSAGTLDRLIQAAILLRANMDPPIDLAPPNPCPVVTQPVFALGLRDEGTRLTLLLRHPGAGWFGMDLDQAQMMALQEGLDQFASQGWDEDGADIIPLRTRNDYRRMH